MKRKEDKSLYEPWYKRNTKYRLPQRGKRPAWQRKNETTSIKKNANRGGRRPGQTGLLRGGTTKNRGEEILGVGNNNMHCHLWKT